MSESKNKIRGQKALIDQIMLILFLFFTLIVIGATVADNMQARDKYYNLKKITDNAVLTLAKYYMFVESDESNAETLHDNMLLESTLGKELSDNNLITYTWSFTTDPQTVTATISNYQEDTFWLKWIGLDSLTINAESRARIEDTISSDPTSSVSHGFAPFAINNRDFNVGDVIDMSYALTADWSYDDKNTFYPVFSNCPCDCDFMLSPKFDFSDLGFDMSNCDAASLGCIDKPGQNYFTDYAKTIPDIYNSTPFINFENGKTDSPLCLAGTYLGNDTSTWGTQITQLSKYMQNIVGSDGANLPIEMDLITLNNGALANGIVRVKVTEFSYKKTGNSDTYYIDMKTEVVPAVDKEIEIIY